MSLVENLCFSHLEASGPAGMLEFSVAMLFRLLSCSDGGGNYNRLCFPFLVFYIVRIDSDLHIQADGDGRVAGKNRNARQFRQDGDARPPDVIAEAERLKHRSDAVTEMHEEQ